LRIGGFKGVLISTLMMVSIIALALSLLLTEPASASPGNIIYVPDNYPTIQSAVDNASPGDTIYVRNGVYQENVVVNKFLTLIGQSNTATKVVGGFKVTADNVVIENFAIAGGYEWDPDGAGLGGAYKAGIYVTSCGNALIFNNRIENILGGTGGAGGSDNYSGGVGGVGAGIYLASSTGDNLTSNTLDNIRGGTGGTGYWYGAGGAGGVGTGVYLSSSTGDNLTSNTLDNIRGGTGGTGGAYGWKGADQVGFGIYLDGSSENNYMGVSGSEFNTLDGNPILYFYNKTGLVIEDYTLTAHSNPTNYGKIVLIGCTNCTVENNTIRNYVGISGSTGGHLGSGGAGGVGTGVYLSSSTGDNLTSNTLDNIRGGTGGTGGFQGSGGAGGVGTGVYLSSSTGDNLTSNTLDNIRGGTGGTGGFNGSGGAGGVGTGVYLSSSTGDNLTSNTLDNIRGGTGGTGGKNDYGAYIWGGADQVGFGIYLDGSSQNNYMGVSGSEFNTLDGNPILYFYNKTGLVLEDYTLTARSNPTNYGKIVLISCTNFRVENNTIRNYVGISGSTGGYQGSGGAGGVGTGIYLSSSTGDNMISNTIDNIQGGTGGTGGAVGQGGSGGIGTGIYLSSSTGDNLTSNTLDNIRGGTGGTGGIQGSGGAGGVCAGIYLSSSTGDNLTSNTIDNIRGGTGGIGGYDGSGGAGGVCAGIYLSSSTGDNLTSNTIDNIRGGTGGAGGTYGSGGADQVGFGIYLDGSSQNNYMGVSGSEFNTLDGNPILYFYNKTGLVIEDYTLTARSNPTNYGKIVLISCANSRVENNTIRNYVGISGDTGGQRASGGAGGVGTGVYLSSSTGDNLTSNTIDNIRGGTGGTGGYIGSGGAGGVGTGVYLSSSTGDNLTSNTIDNIRGGTGGTGGKYGSGGAGGVGYGFYLESSDNNRIYHNSFINNSPQARDNGSNYWDNGYPSGGNYWSDYTGVDNYMGENQNIPGSDGVGDTPYNISGGSNRDRYPLVVVAPILVWPALGENINDNTPTLDWGDVIVVRQPIIYNLQVDNDPDFSSPVVNVTGLTTSNYTTPELAEGLWYWRTNARDNAGITSAWSASRSFRVDITVPATPTLLGPADGTVTTDSTPTFRWTAVIDVSMPVTYELQVDNDAGFGSPEINISRLADNTYTPTIALADENYSWRVRAQDNAGNTSDLSSIWTLLIDTTPPAAPTPLEPADGTKTKDNTQTFRWTAVTDVGNVSPPVSYDIEIDNDPTFSSPENSATGLTDNTYTSGYLADENYSWRVRARDNLGNTGAWSSVWTLLIDTTPPSQPTLVWPAGGENINDNTPNLDWNNVSENSFPVLYRVYVAIDPSFSFVGKDSGWITADNWEVSALIDGVYYWRVCAKDNAGNLGENSSARSFRVDTVAPAAPSLLSPIQGENTNDNTPTLSCSAVGDDSLPVLYYFAVSDNSAFPYENRNSGWIAATNWDVSPAIQEGVWYWRVMARDNAGNISAWSASRSFMIDVTPPAAPTLLAPADKSKAADNTPTFDWNDVTDPSGVTYRIQVDNENTFSPPILIDASGLTASAYNASIPLPNGTYYWRVKTTDGAGNDPWSSVWSFFIGPPYTGTATIHLENLYKVGLVKDLQLYTGSKLVVKFYKYDNTFENQSVIHENFALPWNVIPENENVAHPSGIAIKRARLDLTTDNTENVIQTIASFTAHQSDLRNRYMAILRAWAGQPEQQGAFRAEVMDILRQWSSAPP